MLKTMQNNFDLLVIKNIHMPKRHSSSPSISPLRNHYCSSSNWGLPPLCGNTHTVRHTHTLANTERHTITHVHKHAHCCTPHPMHSQTHAGTFLCTFLPTHLPSSICNHYQTNTHIPTLVPKFALPCVYWPLCRPWVCLAGSGGSLQLATIGNSARISFHSSTRTCMACSVQTS